MELIQSYPSGWMLVGLNGMEGLAPSTYVLPYDPKEEQR